VDGYHWFGEGFGNMRILDETYISAFDSPVLDGIIALTVQLFFCYRIWIFQRSFILVGIVAFVKIPFLAFILEILTFK